MKLAPAFLMFALATGQAAAQGYGVGVRSCSEFANAYAANPTAVEDIYFTWAQGFMSALNAEATAHYRPYRIINGSDMAAQKLVVRSYCDEHPLAQYAQAVMALYISLPPSH